MSGVNWYALVGIAIAVVIIAIGFNGTYTQIWNSLTGQNVPIPTAPTPPTTTPTPPVTTGPPTHQTTIAPGPKHPSLTSVF